MFSFLQCKKDGCGINKYEQNKEEEEKQHY